VQKCEDPVIVDLTITPRIQQLSFTQNRTVSLDGRNQLSVAMRRNASYLQFQVIKNLVSIHDACMESSNTPCNTRNVQKIAANFDMEKCIVFHFLFLTFKILI
jgi:hypothetical protein